MANSLASSAASHGFQAKVEILNKAVDALPKKGPVVIITSSYEGEPPDNAVHFLLAGRVTWHRSRRSQICRIWMWKL
jgi:sulfite reductase alpha subunit-like flavoprotein